MPSKLNKMMERHVPSSFSQMDNSLGKVVEIKTEIKRRLNNIWLIEIGTWTCVATWTSTSCRMFLSSRSFSANRWLLLSKRMSILCCQVRRSSAKEAAAASAASCRAAFSSASWRSRTARSSCKRLVHSSRHAASLASNYGHFNKSKKKKTDAV